MSATLARFRYLPCLSAHFRYLPYHFRYLPMMSTSYLYVLG